MLTLWLTGLPAAGKSTIAGLVASSLTRDGLPVEVLDGDALRTSLSGDLGFGHSDRRENTRRVAFITDLLSRNGVIAIAALISPYRDARDEARSIMPERFVEIHVRASVEVCAQRDPKGLYALALAGDLTDFTGVSAPYEVPVSPEITLDTEHEPPEGSAARVLEYLSARLGTRR